MPEIRNKQKERQHAENYLMCRFFSAQEHKCDGNDGNSGQRKARPTARIDGTDKRGQKLIIIIA